MLAGYLSVSGALKALPKKQLLLGSVFSPQYEYDKDRDVPQGEEEEEEEENDDDGTLIKLRDLENQYRSLSGVAPIVVVGHVSLQESITVGDLLLLNGQPFPDETEDEEKAVKHLKKSCVASPFGNLKNGKTEVDEKVRKAWENRSDISTTKSLDTVLSDLLPYLSGFLYGGQPISLQLNKFNLYEVGGFFSSHTDTPKPGVVGTLIVELPYSCAGGQLSFGGANPILLPDQNTWWAKVERERKWTGAPECCNLRIVAFYGNVPHEIKPVTHGHRATVTFYILDPKQTNSGESKQSKPSKGKSREEKRGGSGEEKQGRTGSGSGEEHVGGWGKEWRSVRLSNEATVSFEFPNYTSPGIDNPGLLKLCRSVTAGVIQRLKEKVSLLLSQDYSHSEISAKRWKGSDATFVAELLGECKKTGLAVDFIPVVVQHSESWTPEYETDVQKSQEVFRFTEADIQALSTNRLDQLLPVIESDYRFLGAENWSKLSAFRQHGASHTGNEAMAEEILNHYFSVACFIHKPQTAKQQKRKRKRSSQ